ncbi:MAG TPA: hypothetical protein VNK52_07195 [Hyphomicrobiaceae bacterium]|nr:hypothetical protein [Hyphomicrobiaceae bacterium]
MNQRSIRDNAEHWRQRARESRAIAERLEEAVAKETMLQIADAYEQLAQLAEKRQSSKS